MKRVLVNGVIERVDALSPGGLEFSVTIDARTYPFTLECVNLDGEELPKPWLLRAKDMSFAVVAYRLHSRTADGAVVVDAAGDWP